MTIVSTEGATVPEFATRAPAGMRCFSVERLNDESGVSGTGIVMEGVWFSTGVVVIHWLTPPPRGSINIFESYEQFLSIHVNPHPGNHTRIYFPDSDEVFTYTGVLA